MSGRCYGFAARQASGQWFQIASGYRPVRETRGIGYMQVAGSGQDYYTLMCLVGTNGAVNMTYGSSYTTTQVGFFVVYPLV